MNIESKFALGDKVYVLKNSKAVQIEVHTIIVDENGLHYSDGLPPYLSRIYPSTECFVTMDELVKYITSE